MSDISATIDVKMDGSLLEENSSLKMLGLSFTINLDWVSYIISIIGALSLFLYCFDLWTDTPSCYINMLDKLHKRTCKTVGPSFTVFFLPLTLWLNVGSLSRLCRYYLVYVYLNMLNGH